MWGKKNKSNFGPARREEKLSLNVPHKISAPRSKTKSIEGRCRGKSRQKSGVGPKRDHLATAREENGPWAVNAKVPPGSRIRYRLVERKMSKRKKGGRRAPCDSEERGSPNPKSSDWTTHLFILKRLRL